MTSLNPLNYIFNEFLQKKIWIWIVQINNSSSITKLFIQPKKKIKFTFNYMSIKLNKFITVFF